MVFPVGYSLLARLSFHQLPFNHALDWESLWQSQAASATFESDARHSTAKTIIKYRRIDKFRTIPNNFSIVDRFRFWGC